MTNDLYTTLGRGEGVEESLARRTASIGATWNEQSEQFLHDVARAKAEGMKLSPTLTIAAGYAENARDAAEKTREAARKAGQR